MNSEIYGSFNKTRFDAYKSNFDNQIEKRELVKREDKIALGRSVSPIENKSIYRFFASLFSRFTTAWREDYLINRAERYIKLKQKIQIFDLRALLTEGKQKVALDPQVEKLLLVYMRPSAKLKSGQPSRKN